jgi:hypothetical protein
MHVAASWPRIKARAPLNVAELSNSLVRFPKSLASGLGLVLHWTNLLARTMASIAVSSCDLGELRSVISMSLTSSAATKSSESRTPGTQISGSRVIDRHEEPCTDHVPDSGHNSTINEIQGGSSWELRFDTLNHSSDHPDGESNLHKMLASCDHYLTQVKIVRGMRGS